MTALPAALVPSVLASAGAVSIAIAVTFERRMQRHRRPGVSYRDVTLRKDGGWRRDDLFTAEGLVLQRRAAPFGRVGALPLPLALVTWVALG